jgi:hypothetical protein
MPELSYGRHLALHVHAPLATRTHTGQVDFLSGIALGATNDDHIRMIAAHIVRSSHDQLECIWTDSRVASIGSALETRYWHDLLAGLRDSLPRALSAFAQTLDQ